MDLRSALIRQGNSYEEVERIIEDMKQAVEEGADPEEVLNDQGLEPDYVQDLLERMGL